mmetsp:Transcript_50632/g.127179  ORF Transcript_50632/g.127179 Transcript_50632/m.127179 type:complete len:211 (-) Transcript_50632:71-703(-)
MTPLQKVGRFGIRLQRKILTLCAQAISRLRCRRGIGCSLARDTAFLAKVGAKACATTHLFPGYKHSLFVLFDEISGLTASVPSQGSTFSFVQFFPRLLLLVVGDEITVNQVLITSDKFADRHLVDGYVRAWCGVEMAILREAIVLGVLVDVHSMDMIRRHRAHITIGQGLTIVRCRSVLAHPGGGSFGARSNGPPTAASTVAALATARRL